MHFKSLQHFGHGLPAYLIVYSNLNGNKNIDPILQCENDLMAGNKTIVVCEYGWLCEYFHDPHYNL